MVIGSRNASLKALPSPDQKVGWGGAPPPRHSNYAPLVIMVTKLLEYHSYATQWQKERPLLCVNCVNFVFECIKITSLKKGLTPPQKNVSATQRGQNDWLGGHFLVVGGWN